MLESLKCSALDLSTWSNQMSLLIDSYTVSQFMKKLICSLLKAGLLKKMATEVATEWGLGKARVNIF